jgi:hypothetical protein
MHDVSTWAWEELADADFGHAARKKRIASMLEGVETNPAGKVSQVFATDADRQDSYDALEGRQVSADALTAAFAAAAAKRCHEHPFVFVAVDGSSLTFTDRAGKKELGAVGSAKNGGRGLKVMSAEAISPEGIPLGVVGQKWWQRLQKPIPKGSKKTVRNAKRPTKEKETQHWLDVIDQSVDVLSGHAKPWFQLDREGDSQAILQHLVASECWFTVRGRTDRRLFGASCRYVRERIARQPLVATYKLHVTAGPKRTARIANMSVRVAKVELRLRNQWTNKLTPLSLTVVWTHETSRAPKGEKALDWLLFTNRDVVTFEDACEVLRGYGLRWRIEEMHKTWKTVCRVEDAQLHSKEALIKWATILLTVATRIERLKKLARETPDLAATTELTSSELRALLVMKRKQKKRTETVVDDPTIGQAVRWLADLGGYTGKSSGGPPGAITIARGLHDVLVAAAAIDAYVAKHGAK